MNVPEMSDSESSSTESSGSMDRRSARLSVQSLFRAVLLVAGLVLCANTVMMFVGGYQTGVSYDELKHVRRLQGWFDTGWYVPTEKVVDSEPTDPLDTYVYAPVPALAGHIANVAVGVEDWGTVEATKEAFAVRHVSVAVFGLFGLIAAGLTVSRLTGSTRWGLIGAASLSAIPMWTGHAMFNIKDTPAGAGYVLFIAGLIGLLRLTEASTRRQVIVDGFLVFAGLFISIGTRPGMWPIIALTAAIGLVASLWSDRSRSGWNTARVALRRRLAISTAAALAAYGGLLAVYPKAFSRPLVLAWESATGSGRFDKWNGMLVSAGVLHGQPPPWWYVPVWVANQIPVLLLLAAVAGIGGVGWSLWVNRQRRDGGERGTVMVAGIAVLLVPILVVPISTVVIGSHIYGGIRQLLFIVPPLAIAAVLGLHWLLGDERQFQVRSRRMSISVLVVAGLALVLPTVDQARLFPYNYAYLNEIATLEDIDGRWSSDYWRTSFREAARFVDPDAPSLCVGIPRPSSLTRLDRIVRRGEDLCSQDRTFKYYVDEYRPTTSDPPLASDEYFLVLANQFGVLVPDNCTLTKEISRPLRWQNVTMSYVARCSLAVDR